MRGARAVARWGTWLLVVCIVASPGAIQAAGFEDWFTGATLRVDYYHTGTAEMEHVGLDRLRIEGPWPGSRTQMLDSTNLGKYRVEMVDLATSLPLYSRGFSSIYGEWETTGEALDGFVRTIPEAVRVPEPRKPVQLRIRKRGADQAFREIWSLVIDPVSRFVDRAPLPKADVWVVQERGDPAVKVDLLLLGDGYTAEEATRFKDDVRRLVDALMAEEPFASRSRDFNIRAIHAPSERSGISRPRAGFFRETPLGTRYNSFDSERYILTLDDRGWRGVAAAAPYDTVLILVNDRQYGGGGIYNLYATAAAGSGFSPYLFVHEFGHSFGGLGDEYYTSDVAYEAWNEDRVEPWEPNITALLDPVSPKWGDLISKSTPVPTPWAKEAYESESHAIQERRRELRAAGAPEEALEDLFREAQALFTPMLGREQYADKVGAFEGASYEPRGLYRPAVDCIMFTRDEVGFCPVCQRGLTRVIDLYTR